MAARITRAKRKITKAHIPYQVPSAAQLPERVHAVLEVVHLVFTTGHTAPSGASLLRRDLTERAHDLARMLRHLLPADHEVAALLALILLTDARREARVDSGRAPWCFLPIRIGRAGTRRRSARAIDTAPRSR